MPTNGNMYNEEKRREFRKEKNETGKIKRNGSKLLAKEGEIKTRARLNIGMLRKCERYCRDLPQLTVETGGCEQALVADLPPPLPEE